MFFYRWVIDPNILISYCISAKLHQLPLLIEKYNIEVCADNRLVEELATVIARQNISKYLSHEPSYYVEIISKFLSIHNTLAFFKGSPDINDDYLIDIVIQTKAVSLVTGDKALLKWENPLCKLFPGKIFN